jgi:hypothetical protein
MLLVHPDTPDALRERTSDSSQYGSGESSLSYWHGIELDLSSFISCSIFDHASNLQVAMTPKAIFHDKINLKLYA